MTGDSGLFDAQAIALAPGLLSSELVGPTSTQALAAAGYTHRSDPEHPHRAAHLIERDGRIRARLTAWEVWSWLERRGRKLGAIGVGQR